ncbi:30S ribosomal protein S20 [Candidatus Microgenomates bacterium]|jgi:ribosomal protein S20|nr:30S ribosomal protein S20 [Candidatus Microgenomates bacterium]
MPNLKTSIKDLRQNKRRKVVNDRLRNRIKKSIKKQATLVKDVAIAEGEKNLRNIYKVLDKASKKNIINKGKADRIKSRLARNLNKLPKDNVKTAKKSD